jgi:glycosyltransferase involved in cell wall biosynthesis
VALTVAFAQLGAKEWHGGETLVTNAIRALHHARPEDVRIYILGNESSESVAYSRATGADGVVAYVAPPRWSPRRVGSALLIRAMAYNRSLESVLVNAGVDVVVGESVDWKLGRVASVGWLWDFQHLHQSRLFNSTEVTRRERKFRDTMRRADRLLATASVTQDARTFAPQHAAKIRLIHPFSLVDPTIYERDCYAVVRKYALPDKFFYVPNQFWIHKNHMALFDALHRLRRSGVEPHIVLTGRVNEYRDPEHFRKLMRQADEWGITSQLHYLGVVERTEVYDLIRQSICVVNPSLFEGWGYTVDEAGAVGKRVLASDLPAHREQQTRACEFFDPCNHDELATMLERIWRTAPPGPSIQLEIEARRRMPERISTLGHRLFEALREAVVVHQSGHGG